MDPRRLHNYVLRLLESSGYATNPNDERRYHDATCSGLQSGPSSSRCLLQRRPYEQPVAHGRASASPHAQPQCRSDGVHSPSVPAWCACPDCWRSNANHGRRCRSSLRVNRTAVCRCRQCPHRRRRPGVGPSAHRLGPKTPFSGLYGHLRRLVCPEFGTLARSKYKVRKIGSESKGAQRKTDDTVIVHRNTTRNTYIVHSYLLFLLPPFPLLSSPSSSPPNLLTSGRSSALTTQGGALIRWGISPRPF